ncbi:MAG: anti-sigma factor [Pyrinomonadaceae bacterium]
MNEDKNELMLDLLIKQAVYGLTPEEARELESIDRDARNGEEARSFDRTAAAISLIGVDSGERMPSHIEARISDAADEYFDSQAQPSLGASAPPVTAEPRGWFDWLGWLAAAAACMALAANIYMTRRPADIAALPQTHPVQQQKLSPEQMRQSLMQSAPDVLQASLKGGKGYEAVRGDAVWSDQKQTGYLHFHNLPVNDRAKETYQLWIFDETQSAKTPIDGGTFDVDANGEVVIPINAKLHPRNPKMFAVTVEKPGGVVVSDRAKIAAIGQVGKTET